MAFAQHRFKASAVVLALAISLAFAGGCKGSDGSPSNAVADDGHALANFFIDLRKNTPCLDKKVIESDAIVKTSCKIAILSHKPESTYPRPLSYTQARQLVGYVQQYGILADSKDAGASVRMDELNKHCLDTVGKPCFGFAYGDN